MCHKCSSVVARPCTYLEADGDGGGEEVEELRLLLEDLLVVGEDEEEDAERQQHRLTHDVGQLRRHVLRRAVLQLHTNTVRKVPHELHPVLAWYIHGFYKLKFCHTKRADNLLR